ncbi:modular serine protease-like [Drosophila montana]|uniref:modular serine protease-like n=1 Tax=Drosophila montana TaxID=40370 RepID=UPI00313E9A7A
MQRNSKANSRYLIQRHMKNIVMIGRASMFQGLRVCVVLLCLKYGNAYANTEQESGCLEWEFQCKNGQCINNSLKCNSFKDCDDGSDETFEECHNFKCNEHRCSYGACVDSSKWCDGIKDCWDNTDEFKFDCTTDPSLFDREIRGKCTDKVYTEFQCRESEECIPYSKLCNGVGDCLDNSDETIEVCVGSICPPGAFRCAYGACISEMAACNHRIDCQDGSDELSVLCNEKTNKTSTDEWYIPSWQITTTDKSTLPATEFTSTVQAPETKKSCTVIGEKLRLRTLYNGLPYFNGGNVSHLTTVRLSCSQKYVLQGSDVNTCDNGDWKAPWAECVNACDRSSIINDPSTHAICSYNNNTIDCARDPLVVSTRAIVQCAQGYISTISHEELKCNTNGKWSRVNTKVSNLKCKPDCGRTFDTVKEDPWLVSVFQRISNNNYRFRCLGSIIDPFYVLTVSNCFSSSSEFFTDYTIVLGNKSVGFNAKKEHGYDVRNIAQVDLKTFKPLAMLTMINPFILSAKVRPICLIDSQSNNNTKEHGNTLGEPIVENTEQIYSLKYIVDENAPVNTGQFTKDIKGVLIQHALKYGYKF